MCQVAVVAAAVIAAALGNSGAAVPAREIIHTYHAPGEHHHDVSGFNVPGGEALR